MKNITKQKMVSVVLLVVILVISISLLLVNWENIMTGGTLFTLSQLQEARDNAFYQATQELQGQIVQLQQSLIDLEAGWQERYIATTTRLQTEIESLNDEISRLQNLNNLYRDSLMEFFRLFAAYLPQLEMSEFLLDFYTLAKADLQAQLASLKSQIEQVGYLPRVPVVDELMIAFADMAVEYLVQEFVHNGATRATHDPLIYHLGIMIWRTPGQFPRNFHTRYFQANGLHSEFFMQGYLHLLLAGYRATAIGSQSGNNWTSVYARLGTHDVTNLERMLMERAIRERKNFTWVIGELTLARDNSILQTERQRVLGLEIESVQERIAHVEMRIGELS